MYVTESHSFCSSDCGCHLILGHKDNTPNKLGCRKEYLYWGPSCNSSISTGLTLLAPPSAGQHFTEKLQFVELDEAPLPWGMKRSRNHRNSSYCCNVHQLLIMRGRETFSWIRVDRTVRRLTFQSLAFWEHDKTSHMEQLLPSKSNSKGSVYSFILETLLHCKKETAITLAVLTRWDVSPPSALWRQSAGLSQLEGIPT